MNTEIEYAIGRMMKVRKLAGTFKIFDSWIVGDRIRKRRYQLLAVEGSGALVKSTEAFADDMEPLPVAQTAETLTLMPDPEEPITHDEHGPLYKRDLDADALRDGRLQRIAQPQEPAAPAGHTEPAPEAVRSAAGPVSGADPGYTLDAGAFGGELDPYSIGANLADEPGELRNPMKAIRKMPRRPTYRELRGITYNARFKGFEDLSEVQLSKLGDETPIAVVVTHETNGHGIWIITMDSGQPLYANLEIFYPNAKGSSADATEYAVLLALRQVPIRTEDLEILLLELSA